MPTTSIAGVLNLQNIGAVTSTFTAPESCATPWNAAKFAGPSKYGAMMALAETCEIAQVPYDNLECLPRGDDVASYMAPPWEVQFTTTDQMYFSPAYACPAGWETAGVAAMSDGAASITGVFSPTAPAASGNASAEASFFPTSNFIPNMITSALGPDETAIICCPSGYELDPHGTDCRTTLPATELAGSSACYGVYTGWETITSGTVVDLNYPTQSTTTETWVFDGQTTTQVIVPLVVPTDSLDHREELSFTIGDDGVPTFVGDMDDLSEFGQIAVERVDSFVNLPGEYGAWTGWGHVPALVMINNGTDSEGSNGEGDGEEAAGSATPASLWAVGGALLAGLVTVLAL